MNASARGGQASSRYKTADLTKISHFEFEYDTTYYSVHIGIGYIIDIKDNINVDINANYVVTNLGGKEAPLPENQSITFGSEQMKKVKAGVKVNRLLTNTGKSVGLVYIRPGFEYYMENEFNARINGQEVEALKIGGGGANIEVGYSTFIEDLNINLSAIYSGGKTKKGVDGILRLMYAI
jgi:hypothetical protein